MSTTLELYRDDRVRAVLFLSTGNGKTGAVPTLAIVPQVRGDRRSACPSCIRLDDGTCYAWTGRYGMQAGKWAAADLQVATRRDLRAMVGGRYVRSAAIGDLGALPRDAALSILADLRNAGAVGTLGYTHEWRTAYWLRDSHMASCDTLADVAAATALGWRYFYAGPAVDRYAGKRDGAVYCPSDRLDTVTCDRCGLCDGTARGSGRPSVVIAEHGNSQVKKAMRLRAAASLSIGA